MEAERPGDRVTPQRQEVGPFCAQRFQLQTGTVKEQHADVSAAA